MSKSTQFDWKTPFNFGLIASVVSVSVSIIGMVELFADRYMIAGVFTVGQLILFLAPLGFGYFIAEKSINQKKAYILAYGFIVGFVNAIPLTILVFLDAAIDLRQFMPNVSPRLMEILTFNQGVFPGTLILLLVSGFLGLAAAGLRLIPKEYRSPILTGLGWTMGIGMFSEILSERLRNFFGSSSIRIFFTSKALRPSVALILFIGISAFTYFWHKKGTSIKNNLALAPRIGAGRARMITILLAILLMLLLPFILGTYLSEVANNVLIFALMGLGLNIVVGFAGLLDLGYVAFFAIGAYTMAVLTSSGSLGIAGMSFWAAIPFSVLAAVTFGIILGVPVLRMRGDYLAIVTLGFGEIIRILALSDLLKPYIGGAQGILNIPKPSFFGVDLITPDQFYYVILAGVLIALFIAWRLSEARIGRQWMAMREDEDVAEAMGINLVATKILAFGLGAGFAGLAGGIFASKLTSIFPHSFNLLISINVLSLIIVGGIGSIPGVFVGSLILVGLPEILREFAEYRMLMYGLLLIVMMLLKPEGFWPSPIRKRELQSYEDIKDLSDETVLGEK